MINSRGRRSTVSATAEPVSTAAGRRSLSTQAKKPQEVERVKAAKATPLKKVEATPAKRVLEKTASVPTSSSAQPQSGLKTKTKPEAVVAPTPSGVRRLSSRPGELMPQPCIFRYLHEVTFFKTILDFTEVLNSFSPLLRVCDSLCLCVSSADVSKVLKPKRLVSAGSLDR